MIMTRVDTVKALLRLRFDFKNHKNAKHTPPTPMMASKAVIIIVCGCHSKKISGSTKKGKSIPDSEPAVLKKLRPLMAIIPIKLRKGKLMATKPRSRG